MTEAELRAMIDEGKPLSEIASEMAAWEYDVCSRETLLSYAISEIENWIRRTRIAIYRPVIYRTETI